MYIGILFRCGVCWCIGAVRLDWDCIRMRLVHELHQPEFGYHPTLAEPHQYTITHRNRATHSHTVAIS